MLNFVLDMDRAGSRLEKIVKCQYDYITIYNNSRFDISLFRGNSLRNEDLVGACPAYSILTFPFDSAIEVLNFRWEGEQLIPTTFERCKIFLTNENLGLVGEFRPPARLPLISSEKINVGHVDTLGPLERVDELTVVHDVIAVTSVSDVISVASVVNVGIVGTINDVTNVGQVSNVLAVHQLNNIGDLAVVKPGSLIDIFNVNALLANTEYSQLLPFGTKRIVLSMQENDAAFRVSFTAGNVATPVRPFWLVQSGQEFREEALFLETYTIFFASTVANKWMQIIAFS